MRYIELETNYSTADAEDPIIKMVGSNLLVEFSDWQEKKVTLTFFDADMFSWQQIDDQFSEAPDRIYEVQESVWLKQVKDYGPELKHYKLCFNASYYNLDVLAVSYEAR